VEADGSKRDERGKRSFQAGIDERREGAHETEETTMSLERKIDDLGKKR
jgi:hypothetical protein